MTNFKDGHGPAVDVSLASELLVERPGLPATVEIVPMQYKVHERPRLASKDGEGKFIWLNGEIDYSKAEIRVDDEMSGPKKIITVWHECLHGILEQAGVENQPESVICALAYGLVTLVQKNPELIASTRKAAS